ncbi:hypothetical protein, partial [Natronococcus sp.]|uniref:hypothetical protein n=1 Tax=Natronococcus sp. TaxID=35747 RepID=UPI003A4E195C
VPPDWSDLPVVQVQDATAEVEEPAYGRVLHKVQLTVEVLVPGGVAAADLRDYAADVAQAVGTDPTWSGLAQQTRLVDVILSVGIAGAVNAGASVGFEVELDLPLWSV